MGEPFWVFHVIVKQKSPEISREKNNIIFWIAALPGDMIIQTFLVSFRRKKETGYHTKSQQDNSPCDAQN